jgi:hypothetical protein
MTEEGEIQRAVFRHLARCAMPGAVYWHCPNDKSSRRKAGYLAGAHDVMILHRGKFYSIELKVPKRAPTEDQLKFRDRINAAGGYSFVAHGLDQALAALEAWGIVRKAAA